MFMMMMMMMIAEHQTHYHKWDFDFRFEIISMWDLSIYVYLSIFYSVHVLFVHTTYACISCPIECVAAAACTWKSKHTQTYTVSVYSTSDSFNNILNYGIKLNFINGKSCAIENFVVLLAVCHFCVHFSLRLIFEVISGRVLSHKFHF